MKCYESRINGAGLCVGVRAKAFFRERRTQSQVNKWKAFESSAASHFFLFGQSQKGSALSARNCTQAFIDSTFKFSLSLLFSCCELNRIV